MAFMMSIMPPRFMALCPKGERSLEEKEVEGNAGGLGETCHLGLRVTLEFPEFQGMEFPPTQSPYGEAHLGLSPPSQTPRK